MPRPSPLGPMVPEPMVRRDKSAALEEQLMAAQEACQTGVNPDACAKVATLEWQLQQAYRDEAAPGAIMGSASSGGAGYSPRQRKWRMPRVHGVDPRRF